jgi:hypothetical protein
MGPPTAQAFSRWRGFDRRPVRVGFVVVKVALEEIFLKFIGLCPCQTQFTDVFYSYLFNLPSKLYDFSNLQHL